MSKYLIKVTEVYRTDTENEALQLIEESKNSNQYELIKYATQKKQRKMKGEVADEWVNVSLTKVFDNEKEPSGSTSIEYSN